MQPLNLQTAPPGADFLGEPNQAQRKIDPRTTRGYYRALTTLFLLFLLAPFCATVWNIAQGPGSVREETQAVTPQLHPSVAGMRSFFSQTLAYFTERFGFKAKLITLHGLVKVKLLGVSATPTVTLGTDGWLFLAAEDVPDYHRGAKPFSEIQVRDWVQTIHERHQWLAEHKALYAFVVAPNAQSIYPEFLPNGIAKRGVTRLDQLKEAARAWPSEVPLIDLAPALLAHKQHAPLYFKTDTHWNLTGAFLAATHIANAMGFTPPSGNLMPTQSRKVGGGDLARMLGLADWLEDKEVWPAATPVPLIDEKGLPIELAYRDVWRRPRLVVVNPNGHGTALVYRDSFGEALVPWLSGCFAKTLWIDSYDFSKDEVLREKPDVVIEMVVERKLMVLAGPGKEIASEGDVQ